MDIEIGPNVRNLIYETKRETACTQLDQILSSDGPPLPLPRDRGCSGDQRSTKRPVRVESGQGPQPTCHKISEAGDQSG